MRTGWVRPELPEPLLALCILSLNALKLRHEILVVLLVAVQVPYLLTHAEWYRFLSRLIRIQQHRYLMPRIYLLEFLLFEGLTTLGAPGD